MTEELETHAARMRLRSVERRVRPLALVLRKARTNETVEIATRTLKQFWDAVHADRLRVADGTRRKQPKPQPRRVRITPFKERPADPRQMDMSPLLYGDRSTGSGSAEV